MLLLMWTSTQLSHRKYRTLDDCSRLREIIKALPAKRHFVPSLLVIHWVEAGSAAPGVDFIDMVRMFRSLAVNTR
jgi:nuclear mRNA export protein SAC3